MKVKINLSIFKAYIYSFKYFNFSNFKTTSGGKFAHYSCYVAATASIIAFFMCFWDTIATYTFLVLITCTCFANFVFAALKIYEMTGIKFDFGSERFALEERR